MIDKRPDGCAERGFGLPSRHIRLGSSSKHIRLGSTPNPTYEQNVLVAI